MAFSEFDWQRMQERNKKKNVTITINEKNLEDAKDMIKDTGVTFSGLMDTLLKQFIVSQFTRKVSHE